MSRPQSNHAKEGTSKRSLRFAGQLLLAPSQAAKMAPLQNAFNTNRPNQHCLTVRPNGNRGRNLAIRITNGHSLLLNSSTAARTRIP
jgi:hypothetical protein